MRKTYMLHQYTFKSCHFDNSDGGHREPRPIRNRPAKKKRKKCKQKFRIAHTFSTTKKSMKKPRARQSSRRSAADERAKRKARSRRSRPTKPGFNDRAPSSAAICEFGHTAMSTATCCVCVSVRLLFFSFACYNVDAAECHQQIDGESSRSGTSSQVVELSSRWLHENNQQTPSR